MQVQLPQRMPSMMAAIGRKEFPCLDQTATTKIKDPIDVNFDSETDATEDAVSH